ncbi:CRISPR-associated helicase/endonuclease Cas3 [Streptomyces sp. Ru87]|uniref:CRISPR-associated helicase/endonuclease Cas3 n=1 Tax=Streptomyces sp. Ru87 TaxID=2044307 RepID=UPI000BF344A6|nr:CRISPR-associated helicase/endonuclease Cas3 [Streptomyces sp. Ru87]PGH46931.1 CRISPR-associated helicase/endonuclease Cas3 [Streptomyces sp. Ru87]
MALFSRDMSFRLIGPIVRGACSDGRTVRAGGTSVSFGQVDCRLWGKHEGLPRPYPLVCHLLDTAAMAGALWDVWFEGPGAERACEETGKAPQELRQLVSFWAGLHDIGKISPPFQVKVPELYHGLVQRDPGYGTEEVSAEDRRLHHSEATHLLLPEVLTALGYPAARSARRHVGHQVAQFLGGHHGQFWEAQQRGPLSAPRSHAPALGSGPAWDAQCRAHVELLKATTGAGKLTEPLPTAFVVLVSGLVVVADWLASQEHFIVPRLPREGWEADQDAVHRHWQRATAEAAGAVRSAGLNRARFRSAPSFVDRFGFQPNALQASLAQELPGLVREGRGNGLLLVTAPAGDGKTEAALDAATLLARTSGAAGIGFSLPTMATVDAMYERVAAFARSALRDEAALTRVHSMAWLAGASAGEAAAAAVGAERVVTAEDTSVEAAEWLHGSRRGLLAPLSVFTIDQGLSAVLPVRYNVLKMLALSGKVLVVDEAHAYGPWMHALLVRLLEWLGALHAPVVVLSATLTGRIARSLTAAYVRGAGSEAEKEFDLPEIHYPGWVWVDAETGASASRAVVSERAHGLRFHTVPVRRDVEVSDPRHRLPEIQRLLTPVVRDGGCALVCCTTVAEAQETRRVLKDWFGAQEKLSDASGPELYLLHSRFRTGDRAEVTTRCEATFGKHGGRPRHGAVLVATQVVEQSLDLDFDLLITDLAPVAQLIQRAGRCQRHRLQRGVADPHAALRPPWLTGTGERVTVDVVVLDPVGECGEFLHPRVWGAVYDESLLLRTSELLRARAGESFRVPQDVQDLVDAVYAEEFAAVEGGGAAVEERLAVLDAARLGEEAAEEQLADMVRIPSPRDMGRDLHPLSVTSVPVDENLVATRLGADSARLVCVYEQAEEVWTLDEAGETAVPGMVGARAVARDEARLIADHVIPVPGSWLGEGAELRARPEAWQRNAVLRGWDLLPMRRDSNGLWRGRLKAGPVSYGAAGLAPDTNAQV